MGRIIYFFLTNASVLFVRLILAKVREMGEGWSAPALSKPFVRVCGTGLDDSKFSAIDEK